MASRGDIDKYNIQPIIYNKWCTIEFEDSLGKSGAFTKLKSSDYFESGLYPVVDQGDKLISGYINDNSLLYFGELPVIIFGDHTRNVKYIDFEFAVGADGTKILTPIKQLYRKFFFYYLKTLNVPSLGYSRHYSILKEIEIPLPPLPEQERIANKLDVLFTQLDGIRAAMEPIPSFLKNFRQQILTQAVTGKLTDVDPQKRYLKELLLDVKYGTSKKSDYDIDGIPVLRIPNINEGEINLNDLKYTIFEEKEYEQLKLKDGDILIIRSNGSISLVGQTAIVRKKHEGYSYAGYLIRMRCNQDLDPEFLNFSLRSGFVRSQIIDLAHSTSGVNNINAEQIKGLKICWFSIPEQQEIVRRVESLFSQADVIEQQCLSLKQKIDNLPQAILHKAFKGELVEQLPTDGDARDLLHQIEELKQLTKK